MSAEDDWAKRVAEMLRRFGDADYQLRAWTGRGPEVSSVDEVVCQLFDDALFEDFVSQASLEEAQVEQAARFLNVVGSLDLDRLRELPPAEAVDDEAWKRARSEAQRTFELLFPQA